MNNFIFGDLSLWYFEQVGDLFKEGVFDHLGELFHIFFRREFIISGKKFLRFESVDFLSEGGALFVKTFDELGLFIDDSIVVDEDWW